MKRLYPFVLSLGLWLAICSALFVAFPTPRPQEATARYFLIVVLSFFCFPSVIEIFNGEKGWGWGFAFASFVVSSFFALRWTSPILLIPVLLFSGVTVMAHLAAEILKRRTLHLTLLRERLDGDYNLLTSEEGEQDIQNLRMKRREASYASLHQLSNLLSSSLVLKEVTHLAVQKVHELIGKSGGIFLSLIEEGEEGVTLEESLVVEGFPGMPSKKGDLFDEWVLKHRRPLLVRDMEKDFRFHPDYVKKQRMHSLMITPLATAHHVTGLLRLASLEKEVYTSDDLHLLSIVGDLVASSIENARLARRTEELARIDELTGLFVHRYFKERLREELSLSNRSKRPFSLFMADIDHFKTYNDRYGHIAGDLVLKQAARMMKEELAPEDILCRYGGEEFSIILPGRTKEEGLVMAERLRRCVAERAFVLRRETTHVTLSVGVATFPEDGRTPEDLLKRVDQFLYQAKREGRNRICGG